MTFPKSSLHKLISGGLVAALVIVLINACAPVADPTPPEATAESNSFLFKSTVSATHVVQSSPCPQRIATIKTFCGRDGSNCTADSVVVTNAHPGLVAMFGNGQQSAITNPDPQGYINLTIDFNCAVAMNFTHVYKLEFFKDGVKVDEQDLTVNMTVQG